MSTVTVKELSVLALYVTDLDRAKECFEKAASLEPSNWRNFYYLGVIYKSRKEWDNAEECFGKVLEINPSHGESRRQIESIERSKT